MRLRLRAQEFQQLATRRIRVAAFDQTFQFDSMLQESGHLQNGFDPASEVLAACGDSSAGAGIPRQAAHSSELKQVVNFMPFSLLSRTRLL